MAKFLVGSQVSAPMSLKAPYGLDSRSTANTIEEVLTQYPASCRYLGMKVFVETENKYSLTRSGFTGASSQKSINEETESYFFIV